MDLEDLLEDLSSSENEEEKTDSVNNSLSSINQTKAENIEAPLNTNAETHDDFTSTQVPNAVMEEIDEQTNFKCLEQSDTMNEPKETSQDYNALDDLENNVLLEQNNKPEANIFQDNENIENKIQSQMEFKEFKDINTENNMEANTSLDTNSELNNDHTKENKELEGDGKLVHVTEDGTTIVGVFKAGYITKQGKIRKNWKLRWFEIEKGKMKYFTNPKKQKQKDPVSMFFEKPCLFQHHLSPLSRFRSYLEKNPEKNFELILTTKERVWHFRLIDEDETKDWIRWITYADTQYEGPIPD